MVYCCSIAFNQIPYYHCCTSWCKYCSNGERAFAQITLEWTRFPFLQFIDCQHAHSLCQQVFQNNNLGIRGITQALLHKVLHCIIYTLWVHSIFMYVQKYFPLPSIPGTTSDLLPIGQNVFTRIPVKDHIYIFNFNSHATVAITHCRVAFILQTSCRIIILASVEQSHPSILHGFHMVAIGTIAKMLHDEREDQWGLLILLKGRWNK